MYGHGRLRHVDFSSIKKHGDMNLIHVMNDECVYNCVVCVKDKHAKKYFKSVTTGTKLLRLVHFDLAEFKNTVTKGDKHYYMILVDDDSRYSKVYLMRCKDEPEEMLLKDRVVVENQRHRKKTNIQVW